MSLIKITDLTFVYEGSYDPIFEHVSFQMDTNWKLGFVGRNGRGKTTFLNLLLGKYEYRGTITASVSFEYFPYEVKDKTQMTLDVIEGMDPELESWRIFKELNLLKVKEDVLYRPFDTLSSGEQTKVLLAAMFIRENQFLLIDEPTNHLDGETRNLVADYLKSKQGFILVSHDRVFLDEIVDHILSINKADIQVQKGNFSAWWENKERRDRLELAENERLKGEIKRLEAAAGKTSGWSDAVEKTKIGGKHACGLKPDRGFAGHKSAKMMKRAKNLENRQETAIEEKSKLLKNIEQADQLKIIPLTHHGNRLVSVSDAAIFYDGQRVCSEIGFEVRNGDRICLTGPNGCGKSSILKMILGQERLTGQGRLPGDGFRYEGTCYQASGLVISYVSQDTSWLKGTLDEFAHYQRIQETLLRTLLRKLDFERVQFEKRLENLSGGQKKKVLIAGSLCQQAHLYIWDEPLNFIDVLSRIQIEELILQHRPTLLFVEHDRMFQEKIATQVIRM